MHEVYRQIAEDMMEIERNVENKEYLVNCLGNYQRNYSESGDLLDEECHLVLFDGA